MIGFPEAERPTLVSVELRRPKVSEKPTGLDRSSPQRSLGENFHSNPGCPGVTRHPTLLERLVTVVQLACSEALKRIVPEHGGVVTAGSSRQMGGGTRDAI